MKIVADFLVVNLSSFFYVFRRPVVGFGGNQVEKNLTGLPDRFKHPDCLFPPEDVKTIKRSNLNSLEHVSKIAV